VSVVKEGQHVIHGHPIGGQDVHIVKVGEDAAVGPRAVERSVRRERMAREKRRGPSGSPCRTP